MPNDKHKKLYDTLVSNGNCNSSYEDFTKKFSDKTKQEKLYNKLVESGNCNSSFEDFQNKFFSEPTQQPTTTPKAGVAEKPVVEQQVAEQIATAPKEEVNNNKSWSNPQPWSKTGYGVDIKSDYVDESIHGMQNWYRGRISPLGQVVDKNNNIVYRNTFSGKTDFIGGRGNDIISPEELENIRKEIQKEYANKAVLESDFTHKANVNVESIINDKIKKAKADNELLVKGKAEIHDYDGRFSDKEIEALNNPKTEQDILENASELFSNTIDGKDIFEKAKRGEISQDEYENILRKEYANYFHVHENRIGKKANKATINTMMNWVDDKQKDYPNFSYVLTGQGEYNEKQQDATRLYMIKDMLTKSNDMISAAENGEGFWSGLDSGISDLSNWLSVYDAGQMLELKTISDKYNRGEKLSEIEENFLNAAAVESATQVFYGNDLGKWYKAGLTTGASIPFMVEMMIKPYGATDKAIENGVERAIVNFAKKKYGKQFSKNIMKNVLEKGGTKFAKKAASTIATPALMTALDASKVVAGAQERMNGVSDFNIEDGAIKYNGQIEESKQDAFDAVWNAWWDSYFENMSERFFEPMKGGISHLANTTKLGKKITSNEVFNGAKKFLVDNSLLKYGHFGGMVEENAEELFGGFMKSLCCTDQTLEENFSAETLEDTFLGLLPMSIFGSATSVGSTLFQKYYDNKNKAVETKDASIEQAETQEDIQPIEAHTTDEQKEVVDPTATTKQQNAGNTIREQIPEFPQSFDDNGTLKKSMIKCANILTKIRQNKKASVSEKEDMVNSAIRTFYTECADIFMGCDEKDLTKEQKDFVRQVSAWCIQKGNNFDIRTKGMNLNLKYGSDQIDTETPKIEATDLEGEKKEGATTNPSEQTPPPAEDGEDDKDSNAVVNELSSIFTDIPKGILEFFSKRNSEDEYINYIRELIATIKTINNSNLSDEEKNKYIEAEKKTFLGSIISDAYGVQGLVELDKLGEEERKFLYNIAEEQINGGIFSLFNGTESSYESEDGELLKRMLDAGSDWRNINDNFLNENPQTKDEKKDPTIADYDYIHTGGFIIRAPKGKIVEKENGNIDIQKTLEALGDEALKLQYKPDKYSESWLPVNALGLKSLQRFELEKDTRTDARKKADEEQANKEAMIEALAAKKAQEEAEQKAKDTLPVDKEGEYNLDKFNAHHWWIYFNQNSENPIQEATELLKDWIGAIMNLKSQQKGTGKKQGIRNANAIIRNEKNISELMAEMGITDETAVNAKRAEIEKQIADEKAEAAEEEKKKKEAEEEAKATTEKKAEIKSKRINKLPISEQCTELINKFGDVKALSMIRGLANKAIEKAAEQRAKIESDETSPAGKIVAAEEAESFDKKANEYIDFLNKLGLSFDRAAAEQKALDKYNSELQREVNEQRRIAEEQRKAFESAKHTAVGNIEAIKNDIHKMIVQASDIADEVDLTNEQEKIDALFNAEDEIKNIQSNAQNATSNELLNSSIAAATALKEQCTTILDACKKEKKRIIASESAKKKEQKESERASEKAKKDAEKAAEKARKEAEKAEKKAKKDAEKNNSSTTTPVVYEQDAESNTQEEGEEDKFEKTVKQYIDDAVEYVKGEVKQLEKKFTPKSKLEEEYETLDEKIKTLNSRSKSIIHNLLQYGFETEQKDGITIYRCNIPGGVEEYVFLRNLSGTKTAEDNGAKDFRKLSKNIFVDANTVLSNDNDFRREMVGALSIENANVVIVHSHSVRDNGTPKLIATYKIKTPNNKSEKNVAVLMTPQSIKGIELGADGKPTKTSGVSLHSLHKDGHPLQFTSVGEDVQKIRKQGLVEYLKNAKVIIGGKEYSEYELITGTGNAKDLHAKAAKNLVEKNGDTTIQEEYNKAIRNIVKTIYSYARSFGVEYHINNNTITAMPYSNKKSGVSFAEPSFETTKGKRVSVKEFVEDVVSEEKKYDYKEPYNIEFPESAEGKIISEIDIEGAQQAAAEVASNINETLGDISGSEELDKEIKGKIKETIGLIAEWLEYDNLEQAKSLASELNTLLKTEQEKKEMILNEIRYQLRKHKFSANDIELVENELKIPSRLLKVMNDKRVLGYYDVNTGKFYIKSENIRSKQEYIKTCFHEIVGHYGLRKLIGEKEYDKLCTVVWEMMGRENQAYYTEYVKRTLDENTSYQSLSEADKPLALRQMAADEYMAHMAENGCPRKKMGLWKRICTTIINAVKKVLGINIELTEYDVALLLYLSRKKVANVAMTQSERVEFEAVQKKITDRFDRNNMRAVQVGGDRNSYDNVVVSKEQDSDYLDAVLAGDMEKAQQMVDEVAEKGGWKRSYHGTNRGAFTIIDMSKTEDEQSFFSSAEIETASTYTIMPESRMTSEESSSYRKNNGSDAWFPGIKDLYVKFKNPYIIDARGSNWSTIREGQGVTHETIIFSNTDNLYGEYVVRTIDVANETKVDKVFNTKEELENYLTTTFGKEQVEDIINGINWQIKDNEENGYDFNNGVTFKVRHDVNNNIIQEEYNTTNDIAYTAKQNGYDGVIIKNVVDNGGHNNIDLQPQTIYISFEPNQIKSADAVTYAEDGSIIPLSERFNEEEMDIRYSYNTSEEEDVDLVAEEWDVKEAEAEFQRQLTADLGFNLDNPHVKLADALAEWWDSRFYLRKVRNDVNAATGKKMKPSEDFFVKASAIASSTAGAFWEFKKKVAEKFTTTCKSFTDKLENDIIRDSSRAQSVEDKWFKNTQRERAKKLRMLYMLAKDYMERVEIAEQTKAQHDAEIEADVENPIQVKFDGYKKCYEEWWQNVSEMLADKKFVGLTTTFNSAQEFIDYVENIVGEEGINNFWADWNNCSKFIRDYTREHNVLTQEEYDDFSKRKFYVPQRGKDSMEETESFYDNNDISAVLGAYNELKKAEGRSSVAGDPITQLYALANSSFRDCFRQDALIALYNFFAIKSADNNGVYDERSLRNLVTSGVLKAYGINFSQTFQKTEIIDGVKHTIVVDGSMIEHKKELMKRVKTLSKEYNELKEKYDKFTQIMKRTNKNETKLAYDIAFTERAEIEKRMHEIKRTETDKDGVKIHKGELIDAYEALADTYKYVTQAKQEGQIRFRLPNTGEWIRLNCDENSLFGKKIAQCFSGIPAKLYNSNTTIGKIFSYPNALRRFFSQTYTTKNPYFAPKGWWRGMQSTIKLAFIADPILGLKVAKTLCSENLKFTVSTYVLNGKVNDPMLQEYFEMGGNSGLVSAFKDLDAITESIDKKIDGKNLTQKVGDFADKSLGCLGEMGELVLRFSVYKAARNYKYDEKNVYTPEEAIRIAKECDVNYDRSGRQEGVAGIISSLVPFVNASIQALGAIYNATDKNNFYGKEGSNRRAAEVVAYNFLVKGFLISSLGYWIAGMFAPDDDDSYIAQLFETINDAKSGKDLTSTEQYNEMDRLQKLMYNWYRYTNITTLQYGNLKFAADQRDMFFGAGYGADLATTMFYGMEDSIDWKDYAKRQFVDRFCSCISPLGGGFADMPVIEATMTMLNMSQDARRFNNAQAAYFTSPYRNSTDLAIWLSQEYNNLAHDGEVLGKVNGEQFDIAPEVFDAVGSMFVNSCIRGIAVDICKCIQSDELVSERMFYESSLVQGYWQTTESRFRKNEDQLISYANREISKYYDMENRREKQIKKVEELNNSDVASQEQKDKEYAELERIENEYYQYLENGGMTEDDAKALKESIEILNNYDVRKLGAKAMMTPNQYIGALKKKYIDEGMSEDEAQKAVTDLGYQRDRYFMREVMPRIARISRFNREYDGTGDKVEVNYNKPIVRDLIINK